MPANLSPEYKKAEQAFREATDDRDRLLRLRDMLRTIPKHKGTEHLQADIKSRIKQLTEDLAGPKKGGARTGPVHTLRPEGAAQVALLGPPNAGKSSLHVKLTGSRADVGPYPFTTHEPMPGMLPYQDVSFQLVDLPPISRDYMEGWFVNALQPADAALLVADISAPECIDDIETVCERLDEKRISLIEDWPGLDIGDGSPKGGGPGKDRLAKRRAGGVKVDGDDPALDPFRIRLPTLLVVNKVDLAPDPEEVAVLQELLDARYPVVATSTVTGRGLGKIGAFLFRGLQVVRVYTKTPGHPPEMDRPFTVRHGATVMDVARLVHKDIAGSLKYARAWGSGVYDGQQIGPEHRLSDADVVELHMR